MKEIKIRTPCECQNGHKAYLYYSVRFGEVRYKDKNRGWKRTCNCPTGEIGEGYSACGEDELYTGLADKHGNPVFEGDIVRTTAGRIRVIVFRDGAFHSQVPGWEPGKDMPTHPVCFWTVGMSGAGSGAGTGDRSSGDAGGVLPVEVVGNVHENPEMVTSN